MMKSDNIMLSADNMLSTDNMLSDNIMFVTLLPSPLPLHRK
jgi:hypothetical protein